MLWYILQSAANIIESINAMRYHVTRIKSEIIKVPKARKTFGKLYWAIQLSSFPSFFVCVLLTMK